MKKVHLASNGWEVICCPEDGGRLESLRFAGVDLLTVPHARVPPNASDYGRYETRPVYGYDDCFPSVDPCRSPAGGHAVPDHGELCWLPWQVQAEGNRLRCRVSSDVSPVEFSRTLTFGEGALKWDFMVTNKSRNVFPFLHVMHALMPVNEVEEIHLPAFSELFDEANDRPMKVMGREALSRRLLNLERGTAAMFLLRNVNDGVVQVRFRNQIKLLIEFPAHLFPTLGIWWDNGGYPDEEGYGRSECAFEPLPGTCSSLEHSYRDGVSLVVGPGRTMSWTIDWKVDCARRTNA